MRRTCGKVRFMAREREQVEVLGTRLDLRRRPLTRARRTRHDCHRAALRLKLLLVGVRERREDVEEREEAEDEERGPREGEHGRLRRVLREGSCVSVD